MEKSRLKSVGVVLSVVFCVLLGLQANQAFGYSGEISIAKNNLVTVEEYTQLKSFAPAKYQAFLDSCIDSVNQGRDSYYQVSMWLGDTESQGIASVTITNPNAQTFQCVKDASGQYVSFSLPTAIEDQKYFTLADIQQDFPSGQYTINITLSNHTTITDHATLPSYSSGSFPDFVTGYLEANPSNVMQLTWSSVDSDGEYEVWVENLNKFKTDFEVSGLNISYPDTTVTTLNGIIAGKNNYEIGVEAKNTVSTSSLSFVLKSEQSWFAFKTSFDLITQCAVKAGKSSTLPDDSILVAGQLTASDTELSAASEIKVTISSADVPSLYVHSFPVTNGVTLKNGKYTGSVGTSKFTFDSKTHKFSIVANNINLTGLWCPFTVKFEIGTFNTEVTVDEYVANGPTKSLPIQLMVGVRNVMNVDSFKVKYGKTDGSDSFTIKGVFAVKDTINKSQPFSVHLGTEQFTVAGSTFHTTKGNIESSRANSAEGPTVVASFDFAKCTFTIIVTNANIRDHGLVNLDMGVLGINLSNPTQLDLGARRVFGFEELLGYDTLGASWTYDSDFSYSISMPGERYSDSGTTTATVHVNNSKVTFNGASCYEVSVSNPSGSPYYTYWYPNADNQIWAGMTMGSSSSKFGYVINTTSAMPLEPAMGRLYSDSQPFTGDIHLDLSVYGLTFTMTGFTGTATQSLKPIGYTDISVPYGDYKAIRSQYTRTLKGTYHYSSFDHSNGKTTDGTGKFTGTLTQTMWSFPGLGVVQVNSNMNVTISAMGYSIVIKINESDTLKGHS
jgi:hypothetical protein